METTHRGMKSIRPPTPQFTKNHKKSLIWRTMAFLMMLLQFRATAVGMSTNTIKKSALQRKELLTEVKGYDYGIGVIKSLPLVVCRRQH